jgi:hypothetical protein
VRGSGWADFASPLRVIALPRGNRLMSRLVLDRFRDLPGASLGIAGAMRSRRSALAADQNAARVTIIMAFRRSGVRLPLAPPIKSML